MHTTLLIHFAQQRLNCASFNILLATYAMMESRTRTEAEHQAGRTRGLSSNRAIIEIF